MSQRTRAAACLTVLLSCAHVPPAGDPRSEEALKTLELDLLAALKAKRIDSLRALLAEDFTLIVPGSPPSGREAFLASAAALPGEVVSITAEELRAQRVGALGIITGQQRARVRLNDGTIVDDVGAFTDVCEWRQGRWVLVLAHSVSRQP
jgi:ketosteroid isomerase-like protein